MGGGRLRGAGGAADAGDRRFGVRQRVWRVPARRGEAKCRGRTAVGRRATRGACCSRVVRRSSGRRVLLGRPQILSCTRGAARSPRGCDPRRPPRRAPRPRESAVERRDGGGRGLLPGSARGRAEPGRGTHRPGAGRLPADRRRARPAPSPPAPTGPRTSRCGEIQTMRPSIKCRPRARRSRLRPCAPRWWTSRPGGAPALADPAGGRRAVHPRAGATARRSPGRARQRLAARRVPGHTPRPRGPLALSRAPCRAAATKSVQSTRECGAGCAGPGVPPPITLSPLPPAAKRKFQSGSRRSHCFGGS